MDNSLPNLEAARTLWQQGQAGPALANVTDILRQHPTMPEPWELLSYFLVNRKKWAEAAGLLATAILAFPDNAVLLARYAMALAKTGQIESAWQHVNHALAQHPDHAEAILTRIEILSDAGYYDLALADSRKLAGKNIPETAAFTEGVAAFLTGDLPRGMQLIASTIKSGWRGEPLPEWQSEKNANVLVYNSQGFGDLIQFSRYIPRAQYEANLTLQIPHGMEQLIRDSFPALSLIVETNGTTGNSPPASGRGAPLHRCFLMSLATLFGSFDPLPQPTPYLKPNTNRTAAWREKLKHIPGPRIGIVWASPWQMNSPFRVVDFTALKPIIDIAGQHLVSLQLGPEAKQAADAGILDASPFIKDFADSAALISELDLIISLDSAPAHLAGALGKPVWTFLPFSAEWRWLVEREDCIWYPTMRLFRQQQPRGWEDVFNRMAIDLKSFLAGDRSILAPAPWNGPMPKRHPRPVPLQGVT